METAKKRLGRPPKDGTIKRPITIHIPLELLQSIDAVTSNRTAWIVTALREKLSRDAEECTR